MYIQDNSSMITLIVTSYITIIMNQTFIQVIMTFLKIICNFSYRSKILKTDLNLYFHWFFKSWYWFLFML